MCAKKIRHYSHTSGSRMHIPTTRLSQTIPALRNWQRNRIYRTLSSPTRNICLPNSILFASDITAQQPVTLSHRTIRGIAKKKKSPPTKATCFDEFKKRKLFGGLFIEYCTYLHSLCFFSSKQSANIYSLILLLPRQSL